MTVSVQKFFFSKILLEKKKKKMVTLRWILIFNTIFAKLSKSIRGDFTEKSSNLILI